MSITYRIVILGLAVALTGFTNAFASDYQAGSNLTIEYEGNYPTEQTLEQMHEELIFQSAVQVALWGQPIVGVGVLKEAMAGIGIHNTTVPIAGQRSTSQNVIPTANQETVYAYGVTEMGNEPMVFTIAPKLLGFMADAWQRPIEDLGLTGPDAGKGGKYIIVPPGYKGKMPEAGDGVYVYRSPTKNLFWVQRAFVTKDQTEADAANVLKAHSRIYPISKAASNKQRFVNVSPIPFMGVPDYEGMKFWHMLDKMIQFEPVQERDLAMMGLAKTMGIAKGKKFSPTPARKKILLRAQETARAMMIATAFDSQKEGIQIYKGLQWEPAFQTESPYFDGEGHTETHERAAFAYQAMTGAKSMVKKMVGKGSQYQLAAKDSSGGFFNGGNTYRLHVPANVPINNYWSIAVYDVETRSLIENGTPKSSTGSHLKLEENTDGSVDLFFGPKKPEGVQETNFVLTKPDEGWFAYFRYYGALETYYEKAWKPEDFEKVDR